jgi:hypothetical protein
MPSPSSADALPRLADLTLPARRVLRLWGWGVPITEIADRLDVEEGVIRIRATRLRRRGFDLPRRKRADACAESKAGHRKRPCMTCGRPFLSEGIHNRICDPCKYWGQDWQDGLGLEAHLIDE